MSPMLNYACQVWGCYYKVALCTLVFVSFFLHFVSATLHMTGCAWKAKKLDLFFDFIKTYALFCCVNFNFLVYCYYWNVTHHFISTRFPETCPLYFCLPLNSSFLKKCVCVFACHISLFTLKCICLQRKLN